MPNRPHVFAAALFLLSSLFTPSFAADFTILTEELPPYSYKEGEKVSGLAVEVVRELLRRVNHPDNIKIHSWSIAYNLAKSKDNHIIFSTTRTPEREELFKWVGPIIEDRLVFFARKGSGIVIKDLDDARKVKKIGTYKDDVNETFLKERGFNNTESTFVSLQNVKKLAAGRIDLWAEDMVAGRETARREGLLDKIEMVYTADTRQMYMAFSRSTPDEVIQKWQAALDQMKKDGTYKTILNPLGIKD